MKVIVSATGVYEIAKAQRRVQGDTQRVCFRLENGKSSAIEGDQIMGSQN